MSTLVSGQRRIGKTTVCNAACAWAADDGMLIVKIDVPERPDGNAIELLTYNNAFRSGIMEAFEQLCGELKTDAAKERHD